MFEIMCLKYYLISKVNIQKAQIYLHLKLKMQTLSQTSDGFQFSFAKRKMSKTHFSIRAVCLKHLRQPNPEFFWKTVVSVVSVLCPAPIQCPP